MKTRLDILLVERGLAETRSKAAALIMSGAVRVGDTPASKAGMQVAPDVEIHVKAAEHEFVGRGGLKLSKALEEFAIDVADCTCLDSGASTGGFTDCLLQRGAAKVYAVDVGRGQLAWKLQQDPRVVMMDKTNLRHLTSSEIPDPVDIVTLDLSFISLTKILPALPALLGTPAHIVALIKPQFEVGKGMVGKGGIVRDVAAREDAVANVRACGESLGWCVQGIVESPITGADGNVEYLIHFIVTE